MILIILFQNTEENPTVRMKAIWKEDQHWFFLFLSDCPRPRPIRRHC